MFLIADSGSTKTDWCLCNKGTAILRIQTQGINPYHQSEEAIEQVLTNELLPQLNQQAEDAAIKITKSLHVIFYGAGFEAQCDRTPIAVESIAPTIAHILRISAPNACATRPLE